jgi:hypothetical protein
VGWTQIDDSQRVVLDHENLHGLDFSGSKLVQLSVAGSHLERCQFDQATIEGASVGAGREMSEYVECSFDGARIHFAPGGFARFIRCSFRDVDLREWICFAVELVDCTFSGRLRRAFFNGTVPEEHRALLGRSRNEFRGNDFSAMDLVAVAFRTGIDLAQQRLPSGPEYLYLPDAARAIRQARIQVTGWDNRELRDPALGLLKSLEDELAGGQRQLLLRPKDYAHRPKPVLDSVVRLLSESASEHDDNDPQGDSDAPHGTHPAA